MWSRIQKTTGLRAKDELYKLYSQNKFRDIEVDPTDTALADFVEETKTKGPKFSNYTREKLEYFVSRIYELRKNNTDNTA